MDTSAEPGKAELSQSIPLAKAWPEGAEFARQNLSKSLIEEHAIHVLARSLATGRLVAFAGAGISMAYGRMTWGQLLDRLFDLQEAEAGKIRDGGQADPRKDSAQFNLQRWQRLKDGLWPGGATDFQTNKSTYNYTITTQLFDEFWLEHDKKLKGTVSGMVGSAWGRFQQIYQAFYSLTPGEGDHNLGAGARAVFDDIWRQQMASVDSSGTDYLGSLLGFFHHPPARPARSESPDQQAATDVTEALKDPRTVFMAEQAKLYAKAYASFLAEDSSPVKTLVADWGIRRLLTTNYDREIERGMKVFKYAQKGAPDETEGPGTLHDAHLDSQTLSRDGTGQAMCFAVDGPRRHGHVLHLHGDCTHPESLVVTEADYQRLYVDKHDKLDLVQNAVNAAFASNPILFVGSNVQEDDILRPLRQFVTGPAHQRDRMAVAMLPATGGVQYNRYMTLELYLRYGIHTVHYGMVEVAGKPGTPTQSEPWLNEAMAVLNAIDKVARGLSDLSKSWPGGARVELEKALARWQEQVHATWGQDPPAPDPKIQRLLNWLDHATSLSAACQHKLQALLDLMTQVHDTCGAFCRSVTTLDAAHAARADALRIIVEELRTQITTHFFCHKLMAMHDQANRLQRQQMALPSTLDRNLSQHDQPDQAGWTVTHRNRIASASPVSPAFDALLAHVRSHPARNRKDRQRTILITGARGMGLGALFDSLGEDACARQLAVALGGYNTGATSRDPVVHVNLAFSDEVSSMVQHVVSTVARRLLDWQAEQNAPDDLIERLAWALDALKQSAQHRCMVMIGNAGVLFDEDGKAKNGLVGRVWQLLDEPAYQDAPIDFVLVCQEQQVPHKYRRTAEQVSELAPRLVDLASQGNRERERRLVRLNIGLLPTQVKNVILHPLIEPRLDHIGLAMFGQGKGEPAFQRRDELLALLGQAELGEAAALERLHRLIPHRFALTLALTQAFALARCRESGQACLDRVLHRVWTGSKEMVTERAIEAVLDNWYRAHLRQDVLTQAFVPQFIQNAWVRDGQLKAGLPPYRFGPEGWTAISEVLWHLSMFSRPVEADVLLGCPLVIDALKRLGGPALPAGQLDAVLQTLLLHMESWCLIYRVRPRTYHKALLRQDAERYTVHRQMQKYHLRLSGGRNVEAGRWDQFATTMYASQPDDLPALPMATHRKLVDVVKRLARYPDPRFGQELQGECALFLDQGGAPTNVTERMNALDIRLYRLRGAYFLIRSNFSLGVIAHMADANADDPSTIGLMEEYRRLVCWVAREARRWEEDVAGIPEDQARQARRSVFFPGELVWLLNECGVIALAQGKLDEADTLLGQAEQAARRIEADDSGSIHIRIRLHSALVQIERGRPARARAIITPIAARVHGHDVPPLIAEYYLGLIEHLGGNYNQAEAHYKKAEEGLRKVGRSRALAFVLQAKADLHEVMHEDQRHKAAALATEAISLAQQGGHEDVRVIAMMAQARLRIAAPRQKEHDKLFAELTFAERYASRMDMPRIACEVQVTIARLLLSQGETRMSAARASAALEIAALYDLKLMKARALLTLAQIYHLRGDLVGARSLACLGKELAVSADYYSCVRGFRELDLQLEGVATAAPNQRESA